MLTFEIFQLDDNYLDWMITTQLDDNYQEVVIIQWYCSYHPVLSFDVWLHWNRNYVNVYNVRIKGLSGCLYALANGDRVSGNVGLSSSFKYISPAFSINSFAYSVKTLKYVNTYNYMN